MSKSKTKSIENTQYQVTLIGVLKFELISLYGRLFLNRKPNLKQDEKHLLHLGCAGTKLKNWVNADFFSLRSMLVGNKNKPDWMLDLRFPLNCDNDVWDGVFTEHTIEHLYPDQALKLLQELNRTMKVGSWIRVTVPDLKKYVRYYSGEKVHINFSSWATRSEAIGSLTQNYFHLSVWDAELLESYLRKSGFTNIQEVSFMKGTDSSLLQDLEARSWETLYMEAQKIL